MAKLSSSALKILEEKNVIDDHLLDIIGNEFKFDHEKGLSEWLKNSVDAYIRTDTPDKEQYVIFRFTEGTKNNALFECIDFVGMDETDIMKAFKRWGDPEAAKRGLKKRTHGGHGNGGKFYMRQMFDNSYFITYKNGYLNIFGFSKNRRYGFAKGYRNKRMTPQEALKIADISKISFPLGIKNKILAKKTGFTLVRGIGPLGMKNKIRIDRIIEKFKNHPQSRNIFSRINVAVIYNDRLIYEPLRPEEIKSMDGFDLPRIISIPEKMNISQESEKQVIYLSNQKYPHGRLVLRVSEVAFEKNSRFGGLNRIDFMGEIGVIASYYIYELNVRNFPQAAFIHGECQCPILENPKNDAVKNDRTKLIENDLTRVLLQWVGEQIDKLAAEIAFKEEKKREEMKIKISSACNDLLNRWKDKFMKKILTEVLGKGINGNGGDNGGKIRKILEAPRDLEFSFSLAKIPINEEWPLTLKARISKSIPIGSIVSLSSNNSFIKLKEDQITITSDCVKKASSGERVGVVNAYAIGKRIGEKGEITANIGRIDTKIEVQVIEGKGSGVTRKPLYPRVLLSGIDVDPLGIAPGGKVILDPRQPLIYQRPQDVKERIYWLNTSAPLAQEILKKYDSHSLRWRDYLLQRYVEIFIKEAIYELQKKDPDSFKAERIDSDILGTLITKIHTAAVKDLNKFLFKEDYDPSQDREI